MSTYTNTHHTHIDIHPTKKTTWKRKSKRERERGTHVRQPIMRFRVYDVINFVSILFCFLVAAASSPPPHYSIAASILKTRTEKANRIMGKVRGNGE